MKQFLLFMFFLGLRFGLDAQSQRFDINLRWPNDTTIRQFILSVPLQSPPSGGFPIVFMFHGTSGDGEKFYNNTGWKELGEKENFVTVFPSSLRYCVLDPDTGNPEFTTKWHCGDLVEVKCPNLQQTFADDVGFVRVMLDSIKARLQINSNKVFAAGFSNGGCFVGKLAIEAGDIFKAVAASGGSINSLDSATPTIRIPYLFMYGTQDDRFYEHFPDQYIPFGGDSILAYTKVSVNRHLTICGLTQTYEKQANLITNAFYFKESQPGVNGAPFLYILVNNMPHVYPNGRNYPLDGALLHWNFFNQVTTATTEQETTQQVTSIYPNPSNQFCNIKLAQVYSGNISMFNELGKIILQQGFYDSDNIFLDIPFITSGLYLMQIKTKHGTETHKIIFN